MTATETSIQERFEYYTREKGWTYVPDPTTWTGGVWTHPDRLTVHRGGGTFPDIAAAVVGMDRRYRDWERCGFAENDSPGGG